ncbi:hypothetical protein [Phocaeicola dorei]|jgi:hypothetical protein|uniref:hypothetical protein n=1 Tax=Phocaeicola dorei TaxID=357276 RepID=UPI001C02D18C|nr:hypothetical protein [Phocaeicola dorei]MBT9912162.1 hypothetical protein [Phocaeicola dorei]
MVKMHKLTKGGQTIFPATIYDAVVNPNTRKSLTTELSELENEEIYLKTQIEGSIDKDLITENTVWIDGTWDWETNSSAGSSLQKQNYKHTKLTDVGYYDTLKMSGLSEKVDISDIFPSISIYSGSEQIEYLRGSSAVINMDKYSDRSNINIIIQAKQDNSIIPSVIANSKAKVVKPEELISIQSSINKLEGLNKDLIGAFTWNKKRWETGTNQPNGGELGYNAVQKIWYARIDISEYDSIICDGLLNGSSISTSASALNGICIYGDNTLVKGIRDASGETIINTSDYSQYTKLELILQCESTSDDEFIPKNDSSIIAIMDSSVASREDFNNLSDSVEFNTTEIEKINYLISGADNIDIFNSFTWNKRRWLTGANQPNGTTQGYNSIQKLWSTDKLDISNYDTVTIKGLSNNGSLSNNTNRLSSLVLYGNDNVIYELTNGTGPVTINTSDYSQYTKLELILQTKSTSDNEFIAVGEPSVVVYKAGISSEKPKPKRVVIVGDSLCGNDTALIRYELGNILKNRGYELIPHTQGGEKTIGNLTRAGGIGIRVKGEFTIPANGTVICALESAWIKSDGNYQDTPYNSISSGQNVQVVINGIRGKLAKQAIDAVGIAFYTENGTFIKSLSETGTHSIPSSATKYAFTINNPNVGEPHITINEDTVDIETNTTRDGYIDSKGQYHYSELFKCSELLPINQGEIYFDSLATSLLYEFTRLEEGRETKIGVGNVFFDAALYDDKDYPHIWFTGQNSGYESEEDWANMVRSSANNFSEKYIVCSTPLVATNAKLIYQANKCFGARYINLRAYTQGQAVYDGQALGIIEGQYTASDYETLFWPGSDKIHQNNLLSYIWAAKMWNTLLELGYVEGERIETGDYYLP